ncbi:hypothetical protein HGQ17_13840 [Nesterenkonia sp. MY13]|uniref:Uncharacterized protein n=1 Tax=Nesterenkonia sedimenti TaxID=1463632 RepID=A0A7X8TM36_9MICC|nr:hypothetical protein [Nesterenkonia sedimenti]NLS11056.1 hypothetical protein [Nesterenkonia sedimenti]
MLLQFYSKYAGRVSLVDEARLCQSSAVLEKELEELTVDPSRTSTVADNPLFVEVSDLYELKALEMLRESEAQSLHRILQASTLLPTTTVDIVGAVETIVSDTNEQLPTSSCDCEELRSENVLLMEQMHEAQATLLEYVAKKEASDKAVRDKKAKLVDLSRKLKASRERVSELRRSLREEQARVKALRDKYEDRGRRIQQVRAREKDAKGRADRLQSELRAIKRSRRWKIMNALRGPLR